MQILKGIIYVVLLLVYLLIVNVITSLLVVYPIFWVIDWICQFSGWIFWVEIVFATFLAIPILSILYSLATTLLIFLFGIIYRVAPYPKFTVPTTIIFAGLNFLNAIFWYYHNNTFPGSRNKFEFFIYVAIFYAITTIIVKMANRINEIQQLSNDK
jgi:hypothetical protein